eukprot:jgi/Ulvmu1/8446/UM043_0024.1
MGQTTRQKDQNSTAERATYEALMPLYKQETLDGVPLMRWSVPAMVRGEANLKPGPSSAGHTVEFRPYAKALIASMLDQQNNMDKLFLPGSTMLPVTRTHAQDAVVLLEEIEYTGPELNHWLNVVPAADIKRLTGRGQAPEAPINSMWSCYYMPDTTPASMSSTCHSQVQSL